MEFVLPFLVAILVLVLSFALGRSRDKVRILERECAHATALAAQATIKAGELAAALSQVRDYATQLEQDIHGYVEDAKKPDVRTFAPPPGMHSCSLGMRLPPNLPPAVGDLTWRCAECGQTIDLIR